MAARSRHSGVAERPARVIRGRRALCVAVLGGVCGCWDGGGDRRSEPAVGSARLAPRPDERPRAFARVAPAAEIAETAAPTGDPARAADPARERRVERPVFRLGDNRLLAHAGHGDALFIAAGAPGFAKYARFGMPRLTWRLNRRVDGRPVALAENSALLEVPLAAEQLAGAVLAMRVHSPGGGRLAVAVNRRPAARRGDRVALAPGWQTVTVPIAEHLLVAGENLFELEIDGAGDRPLAVAWLRIGPPPPDHRRPGRAGDDHEPPPRYHEDSDRFTLGRDRGLSYYVHIPPGAHLVADVTAAPGAVDVNGMRPERPCALAVRVRAPGVDRAAELRGEDAAVDLGALGGRAVRLDLHNRSCPEVSLARARLTVPGRAPERRAALPPEYVILWVMDTLRADRVRPFQPGARPEVPNLEALAARSTVFRRFWVQGNESQGSHSSLWTSLYPLVHRVRTAGNDQNFVLSDDFDKIAPLVRERGFSTLGVTVNRFVSKGSGYATGFEVWRNLKREGRRGHIPGAALYELAMELMAERYRDSKVYLFLSTYDTHKPWVAHRPWIDRYDKGRYRGPHHDVVRPSDLGMEPGRMKCTVMPEPRDLARINAIYDSDVSYQDALVGRLVAQLEDWGILQETLIIITADHGEELWEAGRCGHGASLRETVVRVPLLIHYPPLFPAGRVVDEGVESVDVLPSILGALGHPPPAGAQGQSLVALAQGTRGGYPEPSYASQYEYAHAMRLGDWKLWVRRAEPPRLYNLALDPDEKRTFEAEHPIARRFVSDAFSLFMVYRRVWKKHLWGPASNMRARAARDLGALADPP